MGLTGMTRFLSPSLVMAVLMTALLALVLTTFHRYGFTTDDVNGFVRAKKTLEFLRSAGADREGVMQFRLTNFYGAMPDVIALALQMKLKILSYDSRHLVSAFFGVTGIFYVFLLGRLSGDKWTGPVAAILLAFNPLWLGYMFINIKDIPFAAALLAASYHSLHILGNEQRPNWVAWLSLTVWSGLLATTKLLGLLMLGVVVFILLAALLAERRRFNIRILAFRSAGVTVSVVVGMLLGAILFWPQLFLYTPSQLLGVIGMFMDFTEWKGNVLLNGAIYPADNVPRYYVLTYLLVTTPLFLLALFALAVPFGFWSSRYHVLGFVAVPVAFLVV